MKANSIRVKGQNYERELAKEIEKILGGRAWRSPCSGGLWWNKADINCKDNVMTRFHIECKRQEKWSLDTWYGQALRGAMIDKIPMVVARKSRDVSMVYLKWSDFLCLMEELQK